MLHANLTNTTPNASACLRGSSLAQCALSLKQLSARPGFNPHTRQNKLFQARGFDGVLYNLWALSGYGD